MQSVWNRVSSFQLQSASPFVTVSGLPAVQKTFLHRDIVIVIRICDLCRSLVWCNRVKITFAIMNITENTTWQACKILNLAAWCLKHLNYFHVKIGYSASSLTCQRHLQEACQLTCTPSLYLPPWIHIYAAVTLLLPSLIHIQNSWLFN